MAINDDATNQDLWGRWDEVDRLFEEVLDQPVDARSAFLAQRTNDDPELRSLVTRLLARLGTNASDMMGPDRAVVVGAFSGEPEPDTTGDLAPGTEVDRYVIVERRGRGGMATVYEAERSDGAFDKRVALKVLRRGLDTDDLIRRFINERQILSSLAHPNIARLLDGGALVDGRPYLVMELVVGQPITQVADERQLDIPGRLKLFLAVAEAVHSAHRLLVVHRDIKPSNILVDEDGAVKLLDFGIAKLLSAEPGRTEPGVRLLTPDYASPEQIHGGPITTGSDIYQLGLLLRELLTGLPPLAGAKSPDEPPVHPSRIATMDVRARPSPGERALARATTPEQLARRLRGDLDIIVAKALRPATEDRYASAEEMAQDVRRHLQGLPIRAHPESTSYLIRKFIDRNPLFLPGATIALVSIVAFFITLGFQNRRIGQERDTAQAALQRALATENFLVDMLRSPDPTNANVQSTAADLTVVEALQRGRLRIDDELAEQPEVKAALLAAIGRTFSGLGRYAAADTVLRQALQLHTDLFGAVDERSLGVMHALAGSYLRGRSMREADSVYSMELRLRESTGQLPDTVLVNLMGQLSATNLELGNTDSAMTLATRAVSTLRSLGDTTGGRYIGALSNLARALRGVKQPDSAETVYREILRYHRADSASNPFALATTLNNLGYLLKTREEFPEAERMYREAVQLVRNTHGAGHPTTLMYSSNLAVVLEQQNKIDEVIALGQERIEAAEQQWPAGNWRVGDAYLALGRFLMRNNRIAESVGPMRSGVAMYAQTLGAKHNWTAVAQAQLGIALRGSGSASEADMFLDKSYATMRALPNGPNPELRAIIGDLVTALRMAGAVLHAERYESLLTVVK